MAFGLVDGVSFTAASSGTGSFVFGSSRSSFRTPAQAVTDGQLVNGQTVSYLAQDSLSAPTQREWGHGVFTSGTNTITRATVLGTSAGGTSAVNFSVPPIVSLTALGEDVGPGGANTNVQFNNAGAFGGDSGFTYSGITASSLDTVNFTSSTTNANGLHIKNNTLGSEWFVEVAGNTGSMGIGVGLLFFDNFSGRRALILNVAGGNQGQLLINSGMAFSWASTSSPNITDADTFLTRAAAAAVRFGVADAAAPVAQTLQVQSVAAGTANTAGADWTHQGSLSTGSGTPGQILFNTAQGTVTLSAVTVTISIASPAVITLAAHGLVPGNPVSFATTGALPTGIVAGTTYYVIAAGLASGSFEIAATPGGAAINTSGSQSGTQTISTVNTAQEGANNVLTIGRSGLVVSQSGPAVTINQTWNTGGNVGGAFNLNVTNIASGSFSSLMNIVENGTTIFSIGSAASGGLVGLHILGTGANGNGTYGSPIVQIGSGTNNACLDIYTGSGIANFAIGQPGSETLLFHLSNGFGSAFPWLGAANNCSIGWLSGNDPSAGGTPDTMLYRDAAVGVLGLADRNSNSTATGFRVYNTTDNVGSNTAPTNYERGVFDWTTTANALTIGTQAGGTGTARSLVITSAASIGSITFNMSSGKNPLYMNGSAANIVMPATWQSQSAVFGFNAASNDATSGSLDTGIFRSASKVLGISATTDGSVLGWLNYGGQLRVTADVTATSTTTLATATGLSVALAAGRTYSFMAELSWTDAAAGGLQLAMVATGGLTATNIIYDGYIIDSGANGIKGNAQATALGGVVASSTTTGTAGHARVSGTITVNVAGTLNLQFAQNTSNGTATTIKRGSYMIVHDMP